MPQNIDEVSTDLAVTEHISESFSAINKFITAKIKRQLESNYVDAKKLLELAVKEDFSFSTGRALRRSLIISTVRWKSAPTRSILLTKQMRGIW